MAELGKLEMNFEKKEKRVELKMVNIDPVIQFQIMELCMKGINEELSENPKIDDVKESENVISKTGLTEDEVKTGYQLLAGLDEKENNEPLYVNHAPRINTYVKNKSIQMRNGVKYYQLFYICPECGNKGKRHITPGTPSVKCHKYDCGRDMMVRLATPKGLPNHDEWGNYYIAGEFKMSMKDKEDDSEFLKEQEQEQDERMLIFN